MKNLTMVVKSRFLNLPIGVSYMGILPWEFHEKLERLRDDEDEAKHLSLETMTNSFRSTSEVKVPVSGVGSEMDFNVPIYIVALSEQSAGTHSMPSVSMPGVTYTGLIKTPLISPVGYKKSGRAELNPLGKSRRTLKHLRLKIILKLIKSLNALMRWLGSHVSAI